MFFAAMPGTRCQGGDYDNPIVFIVGGDPIALGLFVSLKRPGGSITGVTPLNDELAPKLLELLHELVPKAAIIGYLINPNNATSENLSRQVQVVNILNASSEHDFEPAFATLGEIRAGGLCVQGDTFFNGRRDQLVALAAHHSIPHGLRIPRLRCRGRSY
jgi:ABC transporter substrate binding protein